MERPPKKYVCEKCGYLGDTPEHEGWKPLTDVQWMNIVNLNHAWRNVDKEDAINEVVKLVEAKCKANNLAIARLVEPEKKMQDALMKFDPATGEERPYPSHATQWRNWHGIAAWLFDPWTGKRRNAYDVGSDVCGLLIAPAGALGMDMGGGGINKAPEDKT